MSDVVPKRSHENPAYMKLEEIFFDFQAAENLYNELQPQEWTLPVGAALDAVVSRMRECRKHQIWLLGAPQNDLEQLITSAEEDKDVLDKWERGNLQRFRHIFTHFSGYIADGTLIDRYENTLAEAEHKWMATLVVAEKQGHAAAFQEQIPVLEQVFDVRRQVATLPAQLLGIEISEACVDLYNPTKRNAEIDLVLASLKTQSADIFQGILKQDAITEKPLPLPAVAVEKQLRLFEKITEAVLLAAGWDKASLTEAGVTTRVSTAQTGFSWGHRQDITTAIETYENDLLLGLTNALHENGHLLYLLEMNRLPESARDQPVGQFNGYGLHETSAIFFEQAGFRKKFFEIVAPLIRKELGVSGPEWTAENLYLLSNRPNLDNPNWGISDQVLTANMAWRIKAERKILDEKMRVGDLPEYWAKTMTDYTGIAHDPDDFIVTDSHWFEGLMGYFPAYVTGALAASALHNNIVKNGDAPDDSATDLVSYLTPYYEEIRSKIYKHASKISPSELLERALGGKPDTKRFLARLEAPARPGMPAPDQTLREKYTDATPTTPKGE